MSANNDVERVKGTVGHQVTCRENNFLDDVLLNFDWPDHCQYYCKVINSGQKRDVFC